MFPFCNGATAGREFSSPLVDYCHAVVKIIVCKLPGIEYILAEKRNIVSQSEIIFVCRVCHEYAWPPNSQGALLLKPTPAALPELYEAGASRRK